MAWEGESGGNREEKEEGLACLISSTKPDILFPVYELGDSGTGVLAWRWTGY